MSSSSSSHNTYSADESGYVTGRFRGEPRSSTQEEDPSMDSEPGEEMYSVRATANSPGPLPPTDQPQPRFYGLRVRATARKSVPIPRRVALGTSQMGEPSGVVVGVPMARTPGMTEEETHRFHALAAEVRDQRARIAQQQQLLVEMSEIADSLYRYSSQAWVAANTAGRAARRMTLLCQLLGGVVVFLLVILILAVLIGEGSDRVA